MKNLHMHMALASLMVLLLSVTPVFAQEDATNTAPAGVGILLLLMGLFAILLVGGYYSASERANKNKANTDDDEEG